MNEQTAERPERKRFWICAAICLAVLAAGIVFLFGINRFALTVSLLGSAEQEISYGTLYRDPGVAQTFSGTILCRNGSPVQGDVYREGAVDTSRVGEYVLTYNAKFLLWEGTVRRTVHVVDRLAPQIILTSDPNHLTPYGAAYEEEGYQAFDAYDGDITDQVHREEKNGAVVYTVEDSSGNRTQVLRTIRYYDPVAPVITLLEGEDYTRFVGPPFVDPGYTVTDNKDGDITSNVVVSGEVNPYVPGTYTLEYSVTDSTGNTATATRTVTVEACPKVEVQPPEGRVIYLTFDDGPGPYTEELLDILAKYDAKATFFITGRGEAELLSRMAQDGHALGIHSISHNYRQIYASEAAYFEDLYAMQQHIYEHSGVLTTLVRFPGGSSNTVSRFNPGIMTRLTQAVENAGFQYFDWNSDSMDAGGAKSSKEVYQNVLGGIWGQRYAVVLQHDVMDFSVAAVEQILKWGQANGYEFRALEPSSPPCHHPIAN